MSPAEWYALAGLCNALLGVVLVFFGALALWRGIAYAVDRSRALGRVQSESAAVPDEEGRL